MSESIRLSGNFLRARIRVRYRRKKPTSRAASRSRAHLLTATMMDQIISRLPPLDPNGVPFSNILRGEIAELGSLRSVLDPHLRECLQVESRKIAQTNHVDDRFGDGQEEDDVQAPVSFASEVAAEPTGDVIIDREGSDTNNEISDSKKRDRDDDGEDESDEVNDEDAAQEDLLYYHPNIQMSCSLWPLAEGAHGDLFVTTVRVLFVSSQDECDDVAIDARCIALHAVDSLPSEDGTVSHHVYCQLSDGDDGGADAVTTSGVGMLVLDEFDANSDAGDDDTSQEEEGAEEIGALELYLRPADTCCPSEEDQSIICQDIFEALTQLASLNPVEDDDDGYGGGLFNMMAMMAGGGSEEEMIMAHDGADHDSDDDMVVRLGDSNNHLIEEEVDDNERQAMLERLDNLLQVPPEYEIKSDDDGGQFDDAEDDDDEDIL